MGTSVTATMSASQLSRLVSDNPQRSAASQLLGDFYKALIGQGIPDHVAEALVLEVLRAAVDGRLASLGLSLGDFQ